MESKTSLVIPTKVYPHKSGDGDPFFASYIDPAYAGVTVRGESLDDV